MTYNNICKLAKQGKIGLLPKFEGYFKWDYSSNDLIFQNKDFKCKALDLGIQNRTDFYYIT